MSDPDHGETFAAWLVERIAPGARESEPDPDPPGSTDPAPAPAPVEPADPATTFAHWLNSRI